MKAEIATTTEVSLVLTMTLGEARLLKGMMQNHLGAERELIVVREIREAIYSALDKRVAHGIDAAFDKE